MPCKEEEDEVNREQSYAGINYALQGGGRRSQPGAESAKPKQSFASLSSVRQTKHGRSSCRLVREQRKLAKRESEASSA